LQMEGITPEMKPPVHYARGTTVADILRQGRHRAYTKRIENAEGLHAAQTN